ncbi:SRPBCC family protein [Flagellimonas meridianipacifica]|uniref:Activator of Hsp90 ATPase-like protein n=1 Tax=Flagellimonas meridianipacifica TaxID=1080225 RepID=A0A2T0M9Z1_9FLAO|nr:SRPBCC domain-containing protein [Allomuricauda pacifica]PRX54242.1 activator of Hsp90 ATPase-like protein [Allomuricauda pacifica]
MKTLHFEIKINAPTSKVYQTMLDKNTFEEWTAEFSPTSRYKGSWDKGSKILFLSDDADGKACGMVSRINENRANEFVSIEHTGILEDGEEIIVGEKVDAFAGALEEYTFISENGTTILKIRMDSAPEWEDYFKESWPRALSKLKEITE